MGTLDTVKGWIDDGSGNLVVGGTTTHVGPVVLAGVTLPGSASAGSGWPGSAAPGGMILIPSTGFFSAAVSGSSEKGQAGAGGFTGSLPSAAAFPGGQIMFTDSAAQGAALWSYLISGTINMVSGSGGAYSGLGGVGKSIAGTKLTVQPGGSVGLISDSKGWILFALSGSATLA
jgi:hypothetical protein